MSYRAAGGTAVVESAGAFVAEIIFACFSCLAVLSFLRMWCLKEEWKEKGRKEKGEQMTASFFSETTRNLSKAESSNRVKV